MAEIVYKEAKIIVIVSNHYEEISGTCELCPADEVSEVKDLIQYDLNFLKDTIKAHLSELLESRNRSPEMIQVHVK